MGEYFCGPFLKKNVRAAVPKCTDILANRSQKSKKTNSKKSVKNSQQNSKNPHCYTPLDPIFERSIIGNMIAATMPPTTTPITIIKIGSKAFVRPFTIESTSSS